MTRQVQLWDGQVETWWRPRVVARHSLEDEGNVGGIAPKGANGVQGGAVGHQPVARDAPIGGLEAGHAAEGGRLAHAAAGIGAQGNRS